MPTSSEIRQQFIDFFVSKHGHAFVPSSPVVPHDDPTLLFANAGMNQFKPYFLGTEKPKHLRVANTQKCIRAGGKHNDLDDVGKDTYHHTFFEMLGNWSFGDYFKQDAITWAWDLLTNVWGLDKSRLHVTVFEGDPANGIPRDDEAADIWKSVGVLPGHIHLGNKKDNFWEMGETGPCGPCTEIHIDRTPDKSGAKLVNGGTDQVIEIWNNVFIQFNRNPDQSLTPLPAKHVDTGMGFERICAVIQGKSSNYDTDVFTPIFEAIRDVTKSRPYGGKIDDNIDTAYRVVADHIRTMVISITDGGMPSNEGRGYVIRSIIRRASRFGWQTFRIREPFLYKLCDVIARGLSPVFPELLKNPERVKETIYSEEESFLRMMRTTIGQFYSEMASAITRSVGMDIPNAKNINFGCGMGQDVYNLSMARDGLPNFKIWYSLSNESVHEGKSIAVDQYRELYFPLDKNAQLAFIRKLSNKPLLSGKSAFDLHTSRGLFIDIQKQMASEYEVGIDMDEYNRLFAEFVEQSRKYQKRFQVTALTKGLPLTNDSSKYTDFTLSATLICWVQDSEVYDSGLLRVGPKVGLVLSDTCFYSEQGGQVGDVGIIRTSDGSIFEVSDTLRLGGTVLHIGSVVQGEFAVGSRVTMSITNFRRIDIMRNHTATHLMNLALRQVLGSHVEQKGSLVDDDKTRFDFSHEKPLSSEELREIERRVNRQIREDLPVTDLTMPLDEAKKIPGVRAVFGEKYPDPVRVVFIGPKDIRLASYDDSVEFCGGTHVPRTGTIGLFKIAAQEGVAKGIRRIVGITGRVAMDVMAKTSTTVEDLTARFQCRVEELPGRIDTLQDELKKLKTHLGKYAAAELAATVDRLIADAPTVNGAKLIVGTLPGTSVDQVRTQIDRIRQKVGTSLTVFGWAEEDGKVPLMVALTNDLVAKGLKAGDLIKPVAEIVGGKGGGKPDLAQAGGKDATKLPAALAQALELGRAMLEK